MPMNGKEKKTGTLNQEWNSTQQMKEDMIAALYEQLPDCYDMLQHIQIKLLKYSENVTFLINEYNAPDQLVRKRVFRINRPEYHSIAELEGEIQWMKELSTETHLTLPEVYQGKDTKAIQQINVKGIAFTGIMFTYLEGRMVEELSGAALCKQMVQIGKILAQLHIQSQNRDAKIRIARFSWGISDFFGNEARWGNWRDFSKVHGMTKEQYALMERTEQEIIRHLKEWGTSSEHYGLIHADMHCSNIMMYQGDFQIFDFDDSGYGWYLYDFGCTLVEYDNPQELLTYLVMGYEQIKPLSVSEKSELQMFVLLRRIVRLAWIAGHHDNDTVKGISEAYYTETYRMASQWLADDCNDRLV